eukprot:765580-Hanusia_phi.AAC.2
MQRSGRPARRSLPPVSPTVLRAVFCLGPPLSVSTPSRSFVHTRMPEFLPARRQETYPKERAGPCRCSGMQEERAIDWQVHVEPYQPRVTITARFFEDILNFLDEKGGYVITEEQLKGKSKGEDGEVNFKSIEASFNKPKPVQDDENINVFLLYEQMFLLCQHGNNFNQDAACCTIVGLASMGSQNREEHAVLSHRGDINVIAKMCLFL